MTDAIIVGRDDEDLKKYGDIGVVLLGKHVVGTGEETHMTTPIFLDVLRPHLIVLTCKRGTGKSHSMGAVVEEIQLVQSNIKNNLCSVIIDTKGILWTMKTPNEKEAVTLNGWGLKPRGFEVNVYVPEGQAKLFSDSGVDYDNVFSIKPSQLTVDDWLSVF